MPAGTGTLEGNKPLKLASRTGFMIIAAVVILRTAWISDDAQITLRSVLNLLHGYGPNFNIAERVQAYTHPIWFILLALGSFVTGNVFTATFILSVGISLLVLWLVVAKVASDWRCGVVAGIALIFSRAFIDYSTSGLENPLSHLLILASVIVGLRALKDCHGLSRRRLLLLSSLLYLSRADLMLLTAPLLGLVMIEHRPSWKCALREVIAYTLPATCWTAFSLLYYGSPFPNTAYAKLGAGVPWMDRIRQAIHYFHHAAVNDPVTPAFIALGLLLGLRSRRRPALMIASGVLLYVGYVAWLGGDFMAGRFLTAPLLASACLLAMADLPTLAIGGAAALALLLGFAGPAPPLLSGAAYSDRRFSFGEIADERGYYYQATGLLASSRPKLSSPDWSLRDPHVELNCGEIGGIGVKLGPAPHLIDLCALCDPLLARLPALQDPKPRVGHYFRQVPTDYVESVRENNNQLADPATRALYDSIRLVTRGPLLDPRRLREIVRLNLGLVAKPDQRLYQLPGITLSSRPVIVNIADVEGRIVESGPYDAPANVRFTTSLEVVLKEKTPVSDIDFSLDWSDRQRVEYLSNGKYYLVRVVGPRAPRNGAMVRYRLRLEPSAAPAERFRFTIILGDLRSSLGHFRLTPR